MLRPRRQRGVAGLLERRQQCQCLGRGPRADFVFQHPLTAIERHQRSGAVAGQVVQPDDAAVRDFRRRLKRQQLARMRQRIAPVAGVFGHLRQLAQRQVNAVTAALALLFKPDGELAAGGGRGVAEHVVGVVQIVRQAGGQGQRGAAADSIEAERLAQLEQPLAQRIARRVGIAVGPQQRGQAGPRGRPFQRQPGKQRGVAWRQRKHRAVRIGGARRGSGQLKLLDRHGATV